MRAGGPQLFVDKKQAALYNSLVSKIKKKLVSQ
jgi:hypothetical protein